MVIGVSHLTARPGANFVAEGRRFCVVVRKATRGINLPPRSRWTIYSAWPKSPPGGKSNDFFVGLLNLAVQKNQRCNLPTPYHLTASAAAVSRIGRLNRFPRNSDLQRFCRPPSTRDTRKIIIRRVTILSVIVLAKALGLLDQRPRYRRGIKSAHIRLRYRGSNAALGELQNHVVLRNSSPY